jgi:hypothetical protein
MSSTHIHEKRGALSVLGHTRHYDRLHLGLFPALPRVIILLFVLVPILHQHDGAAGFGRSVGLEAELAREAQQRVGRLNGSAFVATAATRGETTIKPIMQAFWSQRVEAALSQMDRTGR